MDTEDKGHVHTHWAIHKFYDPDGQIERLLKQGHSLEEILESHRPFDIRRFERNLFLNQGINTMWTLICGGAATPFNNANAYVGVGDSTTTEAATQTGLQDPSNEAYAAMNSGYPTYGSNQQAIFQATFGSAVANFTWNEFVVGNGGSDAAMHLNRKVSPQGTKVSGQTWVATVIISLS